jgi:hypothetical protein
MMGNVVVGIGSNAGRGADPLAYAGQNIFIGSSAGYVISTANRNVCIGYL